MYACWYVHACVRTCVRAYVRACVRACVRAHIHAHAHARTRTHISGQCLAGGVNQIIALRSRLIDWATPIKINALLYFRSLTAYAIDLSGGAARRHTDEGRRREAIIGRYGRVND